MLLGDIHAIVPIKNVHVLENKGNYYNFLKQ